VAEPLVAPPSGAEWALEWSSDEPRYGGPGTPPPFTRAGLWLPAEAAILVAPLAGITLRREVPGAVRGEGHTNTIDPDWDPELPP
jgi:hypothetical protein